VRPPPPRQPRFAPGARGATAADLAIGGELDAFWDPDAVAGTAARLRSVPGAGHALTLPGDWRGSHDLEASILRAIAAHVDAL
jgi:hypothetical protein